MKQRWDIFCTVVDNYGDVGICWRLARQLASEHNLEVRLWVDNLVRFSHIAPEIDSNIEQQCLYGVEVRFWPQSLIKMQPADVVIEAFACELPDSYITAMAGLPQQPMWINLEYLSAENWVSNYHCLPSLHPHLSLVKYFFFPGFVPGTGGLLLEKQLLSFRKTFGDTLQSEFWQQLRTPTRKAGELRISLFCYNSAPLGDLLTAWNSSTIPIYLLVPQETTFELIATFFNYNLPKTDKVFRSGQLTVQLIPFLEQKKYDQLLWSCDFNFVRGEDSFIRAQWAARPFIWNVYPQSDDAHQIKLEAFLDLYTDKMVPNMAAAVRAFWYSWNGNGLIRETWPNFSFYVEALEKHGEDWAKQLYTQDDLTSNLVRFTRNQI